MTFGGVDFDGGSNLLIRYNGATSITMLNANLVQGGDYLVSTDNVNFGVTAAPSGAKNSSLEWHMASDSVNGDSTIKFAIIYFIANI